MTGSPEINKVIRRVLSPVLREQGFSRVQTRHNWKWLNDCTWVLDIQAVGGYFSDVTGWPPMSIGVWLGILYGSVPADFSIRTDTAGNLLPKESDCHLRSHLSCTLDQTHYKRRLSIPGEQTRKDIWWIEPDGSNADDVVANVAQQFLTKGLPWFQRFSDLEAVRNLVEGLPWFEKSPNLEAALKSRTEA